MIHSFYRFAALGHPDHAQTIARVMAIVSYLDLTEIKALLSAPDPTTWIGRRDHALLLLMIQTGVRVSELVGLRVGGSGEAPPATSTSVSAPISGSPGKVRRNGQRR